MYSTSIFGVQVVSVPAGGSGSSGPPGGQDTGSGSQVTYQQSKTKTGSQDNNTKLFELPPSKFGETSASYTLASQVEAKVGPIAPQPFPWEQASPMPIGPQLRPAPLEHSAFTAPADVDINTASCAVAAENAEDVDNQGDDAMDVHRLNGNPVEVLLNPGAGLDRSVRSGTDLLTKTDNDTDGSNLARLNSDHVWDLPSIPDGIRMDGHNITLPSPRRVSKDGKFDPLGTMSPPPVAEIDEIPALQLSKVLAFTVPALGAVLADPIMSLIDTACVGQISSIGLAALGPNTSVFGFAAMVFQFFTVATTAMVSRAHDKADKAKMGECVSDGLVLAGICGIAGSAMLIGLGPTVLKMLYTPPELMAPAMQYLTVRALALPALLVTLVGTAACLGRRDSKTPLNVVCMTGAFNLLVDLYLVLGPPKLGIFGAAVATAGAQYIGAACFLNNLRNTLPIKPRLPSWQRVKPFLSAGGVLTLRSVCVMTSYSLATASAAAMGTLTIAAHQVLVGVVTVAQFCPEPLSSCAQSNLASTATKHARGTAHPYETAYARQAGRLLLACGSALGAALGVGCTALLVAAPGIFTADAVVAAAVRSMAPMLGMCVAVYTIVCVMDGLVFSSGRMAFAAGSQVVNLPIIASILALASKANLGLVGVWGALLALFTLRLIENGAIMWKDFGPKRSTASPGSAAGSGAAPTNAVVTRMARRSWNASHTGDSKAHNA